MIGLCHIPGCCVRGRHLGDCDDDRCGGCLPRTTEAGYACDHHTDATRTRLSLIIDFTPDARLVAAGLVRRGRGSGSNKPGSRSPLNDGATDAMDEVENTLTTLARDIAETRGLQIVSAPRGGRLVPDPLMAAARWLCGQIEWLRHAADGTEPYAIRAFDEIATCAGRLRGIVNGPGEQKYLGPCGASVLGQVPCICVRCVVGGQPCPCRREEQATICEGDVYAYRGAKVGRCKTCGAEVATSEREAWLDGEVPQHAFRASEIEDAYGLRADTIRVWAHRGIVQIHGRDQEGRALYLLSHVLDAAAGQAAKRAEAQAKRARRRERAALDEGDAA